MSPHGLTAAEALFAFFALLAGFLFLCWVFFWIGTGYQHWVNRGARMRRNRRVE